VQGNKTGVIQTIVVGDVRGIEQNTRQASKRLADRHQRRRLSQWDRGKLEQYLSEKTGVKPTHLDETDSSQTCPVCLTHNRPQGRKYHCKSCDFTSHRDVVGALNIYQRAKHGNYILIDTTKQVRITYLQARPPTRSKGPMQPTVKVNHALAA